jgi:multidrug efflux pump subunit AcrB
MKRVLAAFARNTVFANILLVSLVVAGLVAARLMIREAFPQFSLDAIMVTVPYPGADPEEVEEGISRKIEEAIEGLEGVKQYNTTSAENLATAWIEVQERYDVADVLERVRSRIDAISTLPSDAERPIVEEFLLRDQVLLLSLSGDMSERRLKEWAQNTKDELQRLPEVSQVEVIGARDYEIGIELSEERLRQYGLSLSQVAAAVRKSDINLAGGTIRTDGEDIRVRTIGRKYTGEELGKIIVVARSGGESVTLDRLATIRDGFTEEPTTVRLDGENAIGLVVLKTPQEDALTVSEAVNAFVAQRQLELPEGARFGVLYDISPSMLEARIRLLIKNGVVGLCIVFLLLWLFLDARLSFWAGMGIPISIAGALVILWAIGGTINMVSLFGLIMVLGIIVDDAIVVGEAIYVHRRLGKPPLRAAVDGVCEVGMPVIAAVTTTMIAFLPLAYIGGIMGKFIRILPVVVISCLAVSLVECLVILPAHLSHLPDPSVRIDDRTPWRRRIQALRRLTSGGLEWFVDHVYAPFLSRSLKWAYVSCCAAVTVFLLTIGLVAGGILKFEVFPKVDGFIVTSSVEFPSGTPVAVTGQAIARMEDAFARVAARMETKSGEPMVEHTLSLVGGTLEEVPRYGPQLGSVQVVLLPSENRGIHSDRLLVEWEQELGLIPGAEAVTFHSMAAGMPGAPIEIWIQGPDMDGILAAANDVKARLSRFDGVYQVQSDFRPGKKELRLRLKPEARALGLTVSDLARQVHAGYYGEEAVRLQRGRDDLRVRVRYTEEERQQLSAIEDTRIRTHDGREVPLHSVADVTVSPGYSAITRTDGMRRVSVSAAVDTTKANAKEISAALQTDFFPPLENKYPGLYVSLQGEEKKMRESFSSLAIGYPMAMLGVFVIMATILRSYAQPVVIMCTVPFGIIGAFLGHLIAGYNLSMMSMFGIVALSGVVVNDAIVLIEGINASLAGGTPFLEAIRQGGVRRFRPVFLTTLSTVGGLMPMILETDLQAKFLIPMALAIASGVAFATILTLVLIPSLLVVLNDARCLLHRLRHGAWPTREQVEPAARRNTNEELDAESTEYRGAIHANEALV